MRGQEFPTGTREEFIANCKAGQYDDVVAIYRSNASNKVCDIHFVARTPSLIFDQYTGPFDAEMLAVLPQSLKYICHNGAGYDNIDIAACTKRDIAVSSTPVAVNNATADVGIFLMIGALRQAYVPIAALRAGMYLHIYSDSGCNLDFDKVLTALLEIGQWQGQTTLGNDPKGKVLGILGMGGIGRVNNPD
jgi:glyoxylate reductase